MSRFPSSAPLLVLAGLLAGGCAAQGESPSLAPRAVEREFSNAPPPTGPCRDQLSGDGCARPEQAEPSPPSDDPALRARVAELSGQAAAGQARFAEQVGAAGTAAGRAGAEGSDSWIEAQQQLSRLETARGATLTALTELDALAIARAGQPTSQADFETIAAAAQQARQLAEAQQAELERLRAQLRR